MRTSRRSADFRNRSEAAAFASTRVRPSSAVVISAASRVAKGRSTSSSSRSQVTSRCASCAGFCAEPAEAFASTAALAIELTAAREAREQLRLLEERNRIARDLPDNVVPLFGHWPRPGGDAA